MWTAGFNVYPQPVWHYMCCTSS